MGLGVSIIKQASGANSDVLAGTGYNVVIEDISFDGNVAQNSSGDNGISLNTIYKSRISRVSVYNNKLKGINIGAPCDDIVIDNTEAYNNQQDGYAFASGTQASGLYCKNVSLINSYSHDNTLYGLGIDTPDAAYLPNINTSVINNRFIDNGTYGVEVFGASSPVIIGNFISGSGNHGIDLGSTSSTSFKVINAQVIGNIIKNQAAGTSCIRMQSIYNSLISGNRCFDDQASPTTHHGITWNDGTQNVIVNNDVSDVVYSTGALAISGTDQIIYGNRVSPSATTHQMEVRTDGNTELRITDTGTAGTSVPRLYFDKANAAGATDWSFESGIGGLDNGVMTFTNTQTANVLNLTKAGRVGILNTAPSYVLDVTGTARATDILVSTFSTIHCDTGNGHGSTDTKIRRFSSCSTTGTDISMSSSAANGNTFTVNTAGVYSISYNDINSGGTSVVGVSVNSADKTTAIYSITYAQGKRIIGINSANVTAECSVTLPLATSDIVYPQTDGNQNGTSDNVIFSMTRVR